MIYLVFNSILTFNTKVGKSLECKQDDKLVLFQILIKKCNQCFLI